MNSGLTAAAVNNVPPHRGSVCGGCCFFADVWMETLGSIVDSMLASFRSWVGSAVSGLFVGLSDGCFAGVLSATGNRERRERKR